MPQSPNTSPPSSLKSLASSKAASLAGPKLHKALAQVGLGSRIDMERLIEQGRVSVDGQKAHIGQRLTFGARVRIDGIEVHVDAQPAPVRVLAYHKPTGEVVTHDDPQNRPTVFANLPRLKKAKWLAVGRLDINTEGLLLITTSGDLANRLMHPSFGLERQYAVRVLGALTEEEQERLLTGVVIDRGRPAAFNTIEEDTGPSSKSAPGPSEGVNRWYKVTISEGRNREVRRMIEALGHAVSRLIRLRYGVFALPRGLKRGAFIELDKSAISELAQAVGTNTQELGGARARPGTGGSVARNRARADRGRGSGPRPDIHNPKHLEKSAGQRSPAALKQGREQIGRSSPSGRVRAMSGGSSPGLQWPEQGAQGPAPTRSGPPARFAAAKKVGRFSGAGPAGRSGAATLAGRARGLGRGPERGHQQRGVDGSVPTEGLGASSGPPRVPSPRAGGRSGARSGARAGAAKGAAKGGAKAAAPRPARTRNTSGSGPGAGATRASSLSKSRAAPSGDPARAPLRGARAAPGGARGEPRGRSGPPRGRGARR